MLTVILDDIRSSYNVGAIMRTLDGVGGGELVCCGITPYPDLGDRDDRSPVVRSANSKQIAKTALGAEQVLSIRHTEAVDDAIDSLPDNTFIVAIEQNPASQPVFDADVPPGRPLAVILGGEVDGIDDSTLAKADAILEIPMLGTKESLNVSVAAGIALYQLSLARL